MTDTHARNPSEPGDEMLDQLLTDADQDMLTSLSGALHREAGLSNLSVLRLRSPLTATINLKPAARSQRQDDNGQVQYALEMLQQLLKDLRQSRRQLIDSEIRVTSPERQAAGQFTRASHLIRQLEEVVRNRTLTRDTAEATLREVRSLQARAFRTLRDGSNQPGATTGLLLVLGNMNSMDQHLRHCAGALQELLSDENQDLGLPLLS
ncbi:hypothetical protein [Streptomyces sp. NBC_01304]|uniref:hypothetical protein n=1 Tax=Streptomyces sp. NBC_01304 TaxID=2903818 RepID=UPI002E0DB1EB|nr:hypothetical protein OG430_00085 [Streptomyces sp. NBC_01304]WSJ90880.1 hypothetical protein OG430_47425 [Streptomyces sp. NBC_01304]